MVFPVVICGYEIWTIKKAECQRIDIFELLVLNKTLESPLDCKEIKRVNPKGNKSRMLIGSTDAEAETPIIWPPDAKNWLLGRAPDAGKDWRWEEKGTTENEMAAWSHWHNGHDFEQPLGVGDGGEAWHASVHGVIKSWTWMSYWPELATCWRRISQCIVEYLAAHWLPSTTN